jgi:GT2 family glycosyltransferase
VLCAHNPRRDYLDATLRSLQTQTLALDAWEFVVVDNASNPPLEARVDISWHPRGRVVSEETLGLVHARMRGFRSAGADLLVFVDDDNVLDPTYLETVLDAFAKDASLGAAGGRVLPRCEAEPPAWFAPLGLDLACRDLGDVVLHADWREASGRREYPRCAPIGAGLAIRSAVIRRYAEKAQSNETSTSLGRRGADLASGEDNDIVMCLLEQGWRVAYLPSLKIEHLIPARRLTREYLAAYAYATSRTWVRVLDLHGIRPWSAIPRWSAGLRKAKAFLELRPWRADPDFIRWRGACGLFDGRAEISGRRTQ